jgi:regulation of enolase protein 1 (concanavalin A-like superfamily)
MQPYPVNGPLTLRMTAEPGPHAKVHIAYKNGDKWIPFREITGWVFNKGDNVDVGVMACSPGDSSVKVEFWDIIADDYSAILVEKGLHRHPLYVNPEFNMDVVPGSRNQHQ